jgi:predicted double-glycine peptidase
MSVFRLLKRTRQVTEYSCGASALQSVLAYWGKDIDERELMKLMGTTEEEGTYPDKIAHAARSLGFEAEVKENLTLDEVRKFTDPGNPMIALAQVWRSAKSGKTAAEEWDAGHYISVLGVDDDNVYFQDPYVRMCKAFAPRKMFEDHWHQIMGGAATKNRKLMHLGILIRGKRPAPVSLAEEVKLASLDFNKFGSLNLVVAKFRGFVFPLDLLEDLKPLIHADAIRPNAFIFLRKGEDGRVAGMEGSGLEDGTDAAEFNAIVTAITSSLVEFKDKVATAEKMKEAAKAAAQGDFGLSAEALQVTADQLQPGESALVVFFENVWERRFRDIAKKYDGEVTSQRLVTPKALAKAAQNLVAAS